MSLWGDHTAKGRSWGLNPGILTLSSKWGTGSVCWLHWDIMYGEVECKIVSSLFFCKWDFFLGESILEVSIYSPRMLTFTLAISCLITSNLPWFMDLTSQVPVQHCSLQHQTSLPSPVTSTSGYCCCFGSVSSFFLELFLHWSPVAYWAPTDLGRSSFCVLSFCLFILFMGFSRQECWSGLPFLLQWTTFCQNSPLWPICLECPYRAWLIVSLS